MDLAEADSYRIPDVDMVVGGFPCQDYSVAKPLSQAGGIEGQKGVLWWEIYRFLIMKHPTYCLFENVDRLLKSPARQRGRDFAIILSCLNSLGYSVEWRVINSAAYGFPQRRKRVFIYAEHDAEKWDIFKRIKGGVLGRAFPIHTPGEARTIDVSDDPFLLTQSFNNKGKTSPFDIAGSMQGGLAATAHVVEDYRGRHGCLGDVVIPDSSVPPEFLIPSDQTSRWVYLKGAKREARVSRLTGHRYYYSEGAMAFPDLLENPSRTILTSEGGRGASRTKHVIELSDGRYRRLLPDELDQLQGFPRGWTDTGMSDVKRAFCMGNALVVGIPHRIGREIAKVHASRKKPDMRQKGTKRGKANG